MLVAQAQQLDEMEAVGQRRHLLARSARSTHTPGHQAQALHRSCSRYTVRQREHPRRIDEGAGAEFLEVDGAGMRRVGIGDEIADLAQRRRHAQGILGQHAQEDGVVARQAQKGQAQTLGKVGLPVQAAKVEEDRGIEQGLRLGNANPGGELLFPLFERQAQRRVAGHDVAGAERKSATVEIGIHVAGKIEQAQLGQLTVHQVGAQKDDAVVLIGAKGLFVAPFGTEGQPSPVDAEQIVRLEIEGDDAARQAVVERRDELRQRFGADALRQHVERQLAHVLTGLAQHLDRRRPVDGLADLAQADALQGEQVALGDDALQVPALVDRQHMTHAVHGHRQRRVISARRQRQRVRAGRHEFANRRFERNTGQEHAAQRVRLGEDAEGMSLGIDHDHRADAALRHRFDDLAQRRLRPRGERLALDQGGERRVHRLLFGHPLRKLALQLLPRLPEQAGDVLGAEKVEDGALLHQAEEILGGKFVAEDVADRGVEVGRGALPGHRSDRKTLARPEGEQRRFHDADFAGLADLHLAALDDAQGVDRAAFRRNDRRFASVVGQAQVLGEKGQGFRFQAIERRITAQELGVRRDQHLRCASAHPRPLSGSAD